MDAGVQPDATTFRILTGIYQESGMKSHLKELKQMQTTMASADNRHVSRTAGPHRPMAADTCAGQ